MNARSFAAASLILFLFAGAVLPRCRANDVEAQSVSLLEKSIQDTIRKVMPACVGVTESRRGGVGSFSGVIVTPEGHILSVGHAVRPGSEYTVHLSDGRRAQAVGLGVNGWIDCALLKIKDRGDWPHVEMGNSSELAKDQTVFTVSHPGVFRPDRGPVVRVGFVVEPISIPLGMIQSTALMEPGDSGGPLFDLQGKVVGIRSQIRQGLNENFDVPVDTYRLYWDRLNEANEFQVDTIPGLVDPGFTARRSRRGGSRVVTVKEDSVAAKADLQEDDVITAVNGRRGIAWNTIAQEYISGKREFDLDVMRGESNIKLKLTFPPENKASAGSTPSDPKIDTQLSWKHSSKQLADLEEKLDDATVTIQSKLNEESQTILGTVLRPSGYVLSKSSCVGDEPEIRLHDGQHVSASIVSRDLSNDLVLLMPSQEIVGGVDLDRVQGDGHEHALGTVLICPNPDGDGCCSVLASSAFRVPKDAGRGYLGVELTASEQGVTLGKLLPKGAAQRSGLREGDIIRSVDGVEVKSVRDMQGYLRGTIPGDTIKVTILRGEEEKTESVRLGEVINNMPHVADSFDGGPSLRRDGFQNVFCHDATLYPHECGGPLFDCDGEFIGLNIARYSRTQCYAIPSDVIKTFVEAASK